MSILNTLPIGGIIYIYIYIYYITNQLTNQRACARACTPTKPPPDNDVDDTQFHSLDRLNTLVFYK